MDLIIFEDRIKYDAWLKPVLVFPLILLIVLGILFYVDAHYSDLFPKESAQESKIASVVLFASTVFVLAVYWLFLPRKIYVAQEKIKLRFGGFDWNIPYKTIISIKSAQGIIVWLGHSFITSYGSQIEIIRKRRLKIRVSPCRRDQFLEYANKAYSDWMHVHGSDSNSIQRPQY
jgi:hypothetical protein